MAGPTIDPKVIQKYKYIAVTAAGVRQEVPPPPGQSHVSGAKALSNAGTILSSNAAYASVEVWPPAPPCHNPINAL